MQMNGRLQQKVRCVQTHNASVCGAMVTLLLDLTLVGEWTNVTRGWKWHPVVCCYLLSRKFLLASHSSWNSEIWSFLLFVPKHVNLEAGTSARRIKVPKRHNLVHCQCTQAKCCTGWPQVFESLWKFLKKFLFSSTWKLYKTKWSLDSFGIWLKMASKVLEFH